ncbi:MAG: KamA family radical SAM protein [Phycisphaerales bacterium]|nr:KamA family radical SAM protein [Phycisphaerales bacterium]MCI0629624.1 KamA family radical SAM protein [Phycisphaerales bacterium]MCI0675905.1 KamA family radical SAM protein [Phycisphaerales bacterium]
MNDDAAGPCSCGLPRKPLSKTVSLKLINDVEGNPEDEPPGNSRLQQALLENPVRAYTNGKNGRNGNHSRHATAATAGRLRRPRRIHNGNGNGNGHTNSATALLDPPFTVEPQSDFVIGPQSQAIRERAFPDATDEQWNDWKWQLRNRIKDVEGLERVLDLTDDERATVSQLGGQLPVGVTPYYASILDPQNPLQGLRKTMVPTSAEFIHARGEEGDPLAEDADSPVPGLVHRYPDRVLFLVTSFCAVYCRYCTRSRLVGKTGEYHFNTKQFQAAIDYIAAHAEIRDVLISGGDPLTMNDERIEWLLSRLRAIEHVEFIRIGSKVPVVLPQRITPELCKMLKKYHPFWMSVHFMHPDELTPEVKQSCERLADAGVPLGSQTVLNAGVNDDVPTMKRLMTGLLKIRVRPYYIYQCDPIPGSSHFRTPIERGLEIIEGLRGHTTGYAVPQFVIDGPGGGGKIPLLPQYFLGRDGDDVLLRNYEGRIFRYPDPLS